MCEAKHPELDVKCERKGKHDMHQAEHPDPNYSTTSWPNLES